MEINYGLYYRLGLHPWEHYAKLHLANFEHQLQVEIEQHAGASPGVLPGPLISAAAAESTAAAWPRQVSR